MYTTPTADRLEHIPLRDNIISFNRLNANPVRYHHWHQCLEILYVDEGYGIVIADNRHYTLRPGRIFIFPPFTLHKIVVAESAASIYRRTIIHIDQSAVFYYFDAFPHLQQKFCQLSERRSEAFVADLTNLRTWLNTLFTHYNILAEENKMDRENVAMLVLSLLNMFPVPERCRQMDEYRLSAQVMLWVEENYMKKISLVNMALNFKKSKNYISRRFHFETGGKLSEYITTYRLRKACELLLHSQKSINDIGKMVGYTDTTYFITSFKKGIGKSPLQYRKLHQK